MAGPGECADTMEVKPTLIVGLGNPGTDYAGTRHNVGFDVIDRICDVLRRVEGPEHCYDSLVFRARHRGSVLYLMKPLTFMNQSGKAVELCLRREQLLPQQMLVICDCLDLPFGTVRLRKQGSSAGQRGLDSIISRVGTDQFPRLRVGIGRPAGSTVDYVLSGWESEKGEAVRTVIQHAAEAALMCAWRGLDEAMNQYNGWVLPQPHQDEADAKQGD